MAWLRACVSAMVLLLVATAPAQEFRALWADTFHAGLRNSNEVAQLVSEARAGHCNAVIVEVRKRGDAYYNSNYEPKATDISPSNYDPLADLITRAHSGGPRLEVHAWITTYLIWNNQTDPPPQANHPYRLHPEWLSQNSQNSGWLGVSLRTGVMKPWVVRAKAQK